jgi:hypothetical protein
MPFNFRYQQDEGIFAPGELSGSLILTPTGKKA